MCTETYLAESAIDRWRTAEREAPKKERDGEPLRIERKRSEKKEKDTHYSYLPISYSLSNYYT